MLLRLIFPVMNKQYIYHLLIFLFFSLRPSLLVHYCGYLFCDFCFDICNSSRGKNLESLLLWYTYMFFTYKSKNIALYLKEKILKDFPLTDLNNKLPYSSYIPVYFFLLACDLSFAILTMIFFFSSPIFFLYLILLWSSNWICDISHFHGSRLML